MNSLDSLSRLFPNGICEYKNAENFALAATMRPVTDDDYRARG